LIARIMFDPAIRWAPHAASSTVMPSGRATFSAMIERAFDALSFNAPPTR